MRTPPYHPELQPIETCWGVVKNHMDDTTGKPRWKLALISDIHANLQALEAVLGDCEKERPDAPFFMWVHYFDPHYTYDSPLGGSADFADQPYDAEIAFADLHIRRLLDALEKSIVEAGLGKK